MSESKLPVQPDGGFAAAGDSQIVTGPQNATPVQALSSVVSPGLSKATAAPGSPLQQRSSVLAAPAVSQQALGTQPAIKGVAAAGGTGAPAPDAEPAFTEFADIPFPAQLDAPPRSTGKLDEVPGLAQFITRILHTAEAKQIIFPQKARDVAATTKKTGSDREKAIKEAYMPQVQYDLRRLGPVLPEEIAAQYKIVMAKKASHGIALVRERWARAILSLFKYTEGIRGRNDPMSYGQIAYFQKTWKDRSSCVDLKTTKGWASLQDHAPVRPFVLSVLDRAWDLAQADPKNKVTFYADSRFNAQDWATLPYDSQDQHNFGCSVDMYIATKPDVRVSPAADGFWNPSLITRLAQCIIAAAGEQNCHVNIYYNDPRVAPAVNDRHVYLKLKMKDAENWHGPDPLKLHLHLDVFPVS